YANVIDGELLTDAREVERIAGIDFSAGTAALDSLVARVVKSTGPRLGAGKREAPDKSDERHLKAARRIVKAACEIAFLRGDAARGKIGVHRPATANKHAEMRLLDRLHTGDKGAVGISKICCAKCYAAILAARAIGIEIDVQSAHWNTYETEAGWPV